MSEPPRENLAAPPTGSILQTEPTRPLLSGAVPSASDPARAALRERLQVFNLVLVFLFTPFWGIAVYRLLFHPPLLGYNPIGALAANGLAALAAGGIVLGLRLRPNASPRALRAIQWATLALLVAYCAWFTLEKLSDNAEQILTRFLQENPVFGACAFSFAWFGPLLCYGTFLPNRWRVLAAQAAVFVLAPVGVCLVGAALDPAVGRVLSGVFYLSMVVVLSAGASAVVYNCFHENRLQQDVIEARRVGPYRLLNKLGEGGMGIVYKAEHRLVKRPVAIKFLHRRSLAEPGQRQRFFREFQALARLSHWNLVEVYDFGEAPDGTCYYVMEYLDGLSLEQLVRQHGPLPPGRALYLLRQACEAIRMAHRFGLVHRDLKPSNLFLTSRGGTHDVVKVLDFGLVHDQGHSLGGWTLTSPGTVMGTPGYMPPEQITGAEIDPRSDIYSLGAVAYFLLTGRPPYAGASAAEVLARQLVGDPEPLLSVRPGLPEDVAALVGRCLARDPKDRFQSADDLLAALDACGCAGEWSPHQAEVWHATWDDRAAEMPATLTLPDDLRGPPSTRASRS